jgi:hypothetical protein
MYDYPFDPVKDSVTETKRKHRVHTLDEKMDKGFMLAKGGKVGWTKRV